MNAFAYYNRGFAFAHKREYDKAIGDLSHAIRLDCKIAKVYRLRGIIYQSKQEYQRAIEDLSEAIRLEPKDLYTYVVRASVYLTTEQFGKAVEDLSQGIRLDPADADKYYHRGLAYCGEQAYDKAIEDFSMAVHLNPMHADASGILAWFLATCPEDRIRNGNKALECANQACKLSGWKKPAHLLFLAAAYAECGNFKEAVRWQKKAIELASDDNERVDYFKTLLKLYERGTPYRFQ